jgi:hypothetical protein
MTRYTILLAISWMMLPAAPAAAQPLPQDVITVGTATARPSTTISVPVYIRDVSGTSLGIDQPPGSRIQSFSIKVDYAPTSAITAVTFTRAGITTALTPTFEASPSGPGTISLLATFPEGTNLIPFTSNAPAPGQQIGSLNFTISGAAIPGTLVTLNLDPVLTQLTDQGGSPATRESVTNGNLALVSGAIAIVSGDVPTLSTWALLFLAAALTFITLRIRT